MGASTNTARFMVMLLGVPLTACKTNDPTAYGTKITGGDKVDADDVLGRSLVMVVADNGAERYGCTGTLLAEGFVLTASHCFKARKIQVKFGQGVKASAEVVSLDALPIPHEGYLQSTDKNSVNKNDIGLLRVDATKIPGDMIPLQVGQPQDFVEGDEVVIAGYGKISFARESSVKYPRYNPDDSLYKAITRVASRDAENKLIFYKSANGWNSACEGDSGGPMLTFKEGSYVIIGTTLGPKLDDPDSRDYCRGSGTYVDATLYADWIASRIRSH